MRLLEMWYHRDSNLGHTDFQSVALPTELWYLKRGANILHIFLRLACVRDEKSHRTR